MKLFGLHFHVASNAYSRFSHNMTSYDYQYSSLITNRAVWLNTKLPSFKNLKNIGGAVCLLSMLGPGLLHLMFRHRNQFWLAHFDFHMI